MQDDLAQSSHEQFMEATIELAARCNSERRDRPSPLVGAIIAMNGREISRAFRGEKSPGDQAEFLALEKISDTGWLPGATVYTTLEPCTTRSRGKVPCAHRLLQRGISTVVIGMLDPNPAISGKGVRELRKSGKRVELYPAHLLKQVEDQNRAFIDYWETEHLRQSVEQTHRVFCNKCFQTTLHVASYEATVDHGLVSDPETGEPWGPPEWTNNRILQCCGCGALTYQIQRCGYDENDEENVRHERLFPPRHSTRIDSRTYEMGHEIYDALDAGLTDLALLGLAHGFNRFLKRATGFGEPTVDDVLKQGVVTKIQEGVVQNLLKLKNQLKRDVHFSRDEVIRLFNAAEHIVRANRNHPLSDIVEKEPAKPISLPRRRPNSNAQYRGGANRPAEAPRAENTDEQID